MAQPLRQAAARLARPGMALAACTLRRQRAPAGLQPHHRQQQQQQQQQQHVQGKLLSQAGTGLACVALRPPRLSLFMAATGVGM